MQVFVWGSWEQGFPSSPETVIPVHGGSRDPLATAPASHGAARRRLLRGGHKCPLSTQPHDVPPERGHRGAGTRSPAADAELVVELTSARTNPSSQRGGFYPCQNQLPSKPAKWPLGHKRVKALPAAASVLPLNTLAALPRPARIKGRPPCPGCSRIAAPRSVGLYWPGPNQLSGRLDGA